MKKKQDYTVENYHSNESLGGKMSFAVTEAFKLLRTNLEFSFPDQPGCKIIGVAGALKGVGKSLVAVNLAYSFAQTKKRVLLIEADLRMPSVSHKTGLKSTPGLSNILAGMDFEENPIQKYTANMDIIAAGDIPPNPSELLGSQRMEDLLHSLAKKYDYIILDLPPVIVVSDALVVSKYVNGFVVVIRQNYDEKAALEEMMRQFSLVKARVLGYVFNGSDETTGYRYNKSQKQKYKKYYKNGYYKRYGYYSNNDEVANDQD